MRTTTLKRSTRSLRAYFRRQHARLSPAGREQAAGRYRAMRTTHGPSRTRRYFSRLEACLAFQQA